MAVKLFRPEQIEKPELRAQPGAGEGEGRDPVHGDRRGQGARTGPGLAGQGPPDVQGRERRRAMSGWCLLTVWNDGALEYVKAGAGNPSMFTSKKAAHEARDFLWMGLEGDAQSLNVVRPPLADCRPAVVGVRVPRVKREKTSAPPVVEINPADLARVNEPGTEPAKTVQP